MIIKVSGLPVNITKSDLDELFSPYGTIQITEKSVLIKIEQTESIAHLELDKNEQLAIQALDQTKWRDKYILYLDSIRGNGTKITQRGGGGDQEPVDEDQNPGGGNQNPGGGNQKQRG
ncbi:hypothetical protein [Microcoleus sp. Pol12A5]|uniref:hypothetical protein n=1 Tax=Microcoleus sp. Pol12A5 TaxID=3055392 RepID=UPI002FD41632